jgi:chemotaxis protein methyltransferase CheR
MSLSPIEFNTIKDLLYRRTGLCLNDNKVDFLSRRVETRMRELELRSLRDYIRYLAYETTGGELERLVDLVVINETYFFRDYGLLKLFSEEALPIITGEKGQSRILSVLSAGCSTGDEAYTLAIILLEMLDDPAEWTIRIDGVDISRKALAVARSAVYGNHALRETPYLYRDKYFIQDGDSYRVRPEVTSMVNFRRVNLFDEGDMASLGMYDAVFFRNVLIYFDMRSGAQVLEYMYERMNPGAFIFLGPSESVGRLTNLFEMVRMGRSFLYRKGRRPATRSREGGSTRR